MFVDMHCDTMLKIKSKLEDYDFSIAQGYEIGGGLQFFACYIDVQNEKNSFDKAMQYINNFKEAVKFDTRIEIALNYNDIISIIKKGKVAAIITIEDCGILEGNLENLYKLYNLGVRLATLTWNFENEIASGSKASGGLKPLGKRLIAEMEKLNMLVDVSHINRRGFYDVLNFAARPVLATHSCCYEIFPHERNLDRYQFKELTIGGGIAGVNFYPIFLNGTPYAGICDILKHMEYFLNISPDSVGIGSDFDGIKYLPFDLSCTGDMKKLFNEIEINYGTEIMKKVSHKNMLRFLKKYL